MHSNTVEISVKDLLDKYVAYFYNKVKEIVDTSAIDESIYIGLTKITSNNKMFMEISLDWLNLTHTTYKIKLWIGPRDYLSYGGLLLRLK